MFILTLTMLMSVEYECSCLACMYMTLHIPHCVISVCIIICCIVYVTQTVLECMGEAN